MHRAGYPQVPVVILIPDVGIPVDHGFTVLDIGAVALDGGAADAVRGTAGDVVQSVAAVIDRERPARLQGDDIAQLKIPPRPILRRNGGKVGHHAMPGILVGVRALGGIVKLVGR